MQVIPTLVAVLTIPAILALPCGECGAPKTTDNASGATKDSEATVTGVAPPKLHNLHARIGLPLPVHDETEFARIGMRNGVHCYKELVVGTLGLVSACSKLSHKERLAVLEYLDHHSKTLSPELPKKARFYPFLGRVARGSEIYQEEFEKFMEEQDIRYPPHQRILKKHTTSIRQPHPRNAADIFA
jgi:hypothetical protein